MARRGTPGKDATAFKSYIKAITKDLGIDTLDIVYRFKPDNGSFARNRYFVKGKKPRIADALVQVENNDYRSEVLKSLAHELRHVWQYHTGKLTRVWSMEKMDYIMVWEGQPYMTEGEVSRLFRRDGKAYNNLPWEDDANKYMERWKI